MVTGVAAIIQNEKGDFLLHLRDGNTSRMTNQWCLIGGHIDGEESSVEAISREVLEETSLPPLNVKFYDSIDSINPGTKADIYTCTISAPAIDDILLTEGKALKFFDIDSLRKLLSNLHYTNPYLDVLKRFISL